MVFGTNFDPNAEARAYRISPPEGQIPDFEKVTEVISSNQLVFEVEISHPSSIGRWVIQIKNPQPGGGAAESFFEITEGTFDQNPSIITLSPNIVAAGGPTFTLTINGTNFQPDSEVNFYSHPVPTTFVSDTQLTAEIDESLIVIPGKKPVTVTNSDNGGTSNKEYVRVE